MVSCPSIDWLSYFRDLSGWRQHDFEEALAARDISLGEYMEIIEHAAMENCALAMLRDAATYSAEDILPLASRLLSHYVKRKAQLASRIDLTGKDRARVLHPKADVSGATPSIGASRTSRLAWFNREPTRH